MSTAPFPAWPIQGTVKISMPLPYHALRDFRLFLPNPTFGNPEWGAASLRVLIVRLSPFADVQRSTPHLFLAQEVRRGLPDAFIDMAFLPRDQDARLLEQSGLPLLMGTQTRRPLADFNLALVSNSWLLEQVNLPFLLTRSGIPVWSSARGGEWPLLILGGSNASAAHALVSETGDCMADAIFFGEGEGRVQRIAQLCQELAGAPKGERVARIAAEVTGVWPAGSLCFTVKKARAESAADSLGQRPAPVLPGPEASTARLSITLGCPCLCSFCFEGHDRAPFREVPTTAVLRKAREMKIATGADTLEIESFNFNTHSGIADLILGLHRLFLRVNLMSQRVDIIARTPGLLELEIAADKRGFTLGIEGISGRCRRFLHKSLEEEEIRQALEAMHSRGTREIKLFYLLTGRESPEDFDEFSGFVKWLKQVRLRAEAAPRIVFSFGMLVRMPFTPLRHDPAMLHERAWRAPKGRVKSICETNGFEFRMAMDWPSYAAAQILALGGHSLHPLLEQLSRAGCVADRRWPPEARQAVTDWIEMHAHALESEKPFGYAFGFPFLDDEASRSFLHAHYQKAKAGQDDGYCRRGSEGTEACAVCMGCTRNPRRSTNRDDSMVRAARQMEKLMKKKHRLKPLYARARLPRTDAGFGAQWINSWFLRELLARHADQADNILAVAEVFAGAGEILGSEVPWFGAAIVAITAWDASRLAEVVGDPAGPLETVLPHHDPGSIETIHVRIELPSPLFPQPAARLAAFLRDAHAPVTVSRSGNALRFTVPEKSLK